MTYEIFISHENWEQLKTGFGSPAPFFLLMQHGEICNIKFIINGINLIFSSKEQMSMFQMKYL